MLPERFWFHLRQIVIALLQLFVEKAVDKRPLRVRQLPVRVPRLLHGLRRLGRDVVRIELFDLFFDLLRRGLVLLERFLAVLENVLLVLRREALEELFVRVKHVLRLLVKRRHVLVHVVLVKLRN